MTEALRLIDLLEARADLLYACAVEPADGQDWPECRPQLAAQSSLLKSLAAEIRGAHVLQTDDIEVLLGSESQPRYVVVCEMGGPKFATVFNSPAVAERAMVDFRTKFRMSGAYSGYAFCDIFQVDLPPRSRHSSGTLDIRYAFIFEIGSNFGVSIHDTQEEAHLAAAKFCEDHEYELALENGSSTCHAVLIPRH